MLASCIIIDILVLLDAFIHLADVHVLGVGQFDVLGDVCPLAHGEEGIGFGWFGYDDPVLCVLYLNPVEWFIGLEASVWGDLIPDGAEVVIEGVVDECLLIALEAGFHLLES
jgi:hypothetical protein